MENTNINPNRMELRKVREKVKVALKGHGLLKDKTSGLIKIFYRVLKETRDKRQEVEKEFKSILKDFQNVMMNLSEEEVALLLTISSEQISLKFDEISNMGAICPNNEIEGKISKKTAYSPLSSSFQFDLVTKRFLDLFPKIIELSNTEKSAYVLADEIEKCKRRTKALENVLIPQYESQIKRIEQKLSNNELENTARLKTIKNKKKSN
ncbi:MAG: V-type ATP synthase subunit D [Clostridia bacterium]|nr:V-type ATP synthase subunit D [Clostridia bacterium]